LNDVLSEFGILLGDKVFDGEITLGSKAATYVSGTSIVSFPEGGHLFQVPLMDQTAQIVRSRSEKAPAVPILGVYTPPVNMTSNNATQNHTVDTVPRKPGTIAVFGDSSCLDDATSGKPSCNWILDSILKITNRQATVQSEFASAVLLEEPYHESGPEVHRMTGTSFAKGSHVVGKQLTCPVLNGNGKDSNVNNNNYMNNNNAINGYLWEDKKNLTAVMWKERPIPKQQERSSSWKSFGSSSISSSVSNNSSFIVFACVLTVVVFIIIAFVRSRDVAGVPRHASPKRVPV